MMMTSEASPWLGELSIPMAFCTAGHMYLLQGPYEWEFLASSLAKLLQQTTTTKKSNRSAADGPTMKHENLLNEKHKDHRHFSWGLLQYNENTIECAV